MKRKTASGIVLALLLIGMLTTALDFQPGEAEPGTIYIRPDGSIDPPTANITTSDNVTYTFTGNIADSIVVQRSNITVDGAGYTLQGSGSGSGFYWSGISNVTVKTTNIKNFTTGIDLRSSSKYNSVSGNNITDNQYGISFGSSCHYNSISGNNITGNNSWYGIQLWGGSSNNTVSGNNISGPFVGIYFDSSHNNTVSGNEFVGGGLVAYDAFRNVVVSNTVNGKPLVYLEGASNQAVADAGQVVLVNCDYIQVQNLNLSYTTIGVELWNTNHTLISHNNVTGNFEYGVFLTHSCSYNTISGNNITLGDRAINQAGILLEYSCNYNTISENNVTANIGVGAGVYLANTCEHNSVSGNVFVGVGLLLGSLNNTVTSNTVNGKPLVYLENASDQAVTEAGQIILVNCTHIQVQNLNLSRATVGLGLFITNHTLISGNTMTDEAYGIALTYSFNNTISENTVTNNAYGITLNAFSSYNNVSGNNVNDTISSPYVGTSPHAGIVLISSCNYNRISGNMIANRRYGIIFSSSCNYNDVSGNRITKDMYGIYVSSCSSNTVSGNTVTINTYGIYVSSSSNNIFYHNNFVDNTNQVYIYGTSTNVWDNGYPSGGNYWSDYTGVDLFTGPYQNITGSDGIYDNPYTINPNNKDKYPLTNPWSTLRGDIDGDRDVDYDDLQIFSHAYGTRLGGPNYHTRADLDQDGDVDALDLYILCENYGQP